jgi:precorrin-6B methylase 2
LDQLSHFCWTDVDRLGEKIMSPALKHHQHLKPYLDKPAAHYVDAAPTLKVGARAYRGVLGHYYRLIIPPNARVLEIGCGDGSLLRELPNRDVTGFDVSADQIALAVRNVPHGRFLVGAGELMSVPETFDVIIISDTLNLAADVQTMLRQALRMAHPRTRLVVNFHSTLWRPIRSIAESLGLVGSSPPSSWLSASDVQNLMALAGWDMISQNARILLPASVPPVSTILNRWLAPLLPWFCMTVFQVARPGRSRVQENAPSVSVLIPARNEAGNIAAVIPRTPSMGCWTEFIFVEGHSKDGTWSEIQSLVQQYPNHRIKTHQQTGKGKGNAVREGFELAEGDILMILDADLTMPPEELSKYYDALHSGVADFANGVRLVYPMEGQAMRFLNLCANKFFAVAFSWVLGQPVKDTLCGTKVLRRTDYQCIVANRAYFGDFDPFGDFDLLFGADKLQLKIVDIPIRYRDRTYGSTQISRFRHGFLLLGMLGFAARKLKFV